MIYRVGSVAQPGKQQQNVQLGDSLTAFYWYRFFAARIAAAQALLTRAPVPPGTTILPAYATNQQTFINSGVGGDDCVTIRAATIAARVTAYKPDTCFHFYAVNCVQHGISDATCALNHPYLISQTAIENPGIQQFVFGPMCKFENWPNGANADDAALNAKAAICMAAAAANGVPGFDLRPPFFAYQALHNPGHLNVGILTLDGIHPNPTGQSWLGDQAYPFATVTG